MKITDGTFVSIAYRMSLEDGKVVEEAKATEPLEFITGASQMMPGVEQQLLGMEVGQSASFTVEPEDGYGQRRPELRDEIPRSRFPDDVDLRPGLVFHAATPGGMLRLTVLEVDDESVSVDMNHPLAGERLHFEIDVLGAHEATPEELAAAQQHACGCDCSHGCGSAGDCGGPGDDGHGPC